LHAVRSSLAGISGALHVLAAGERDPADDGIGRLRVMLLDEVERLVRLVTPDDQDPYELGELDIDDVIDHVVLARRVAGQQITWDPTGSRVVGRWDEVVEVLNILLVNAARHAPDSPVRVVVRADGAMVRLSVVDDGPGVPSHLREAIFERGARRAASPGQGLGLAVARDLVRRMGGTLSLRTNELRGAGFDIRLRRAVCGGAA
jgi:signal transduction histidine kinase